MPTEAVLATHIENFAAVVATIDSSTSDSTRLAYDSAQRGFVAYCTAKGWMPVPVDQNDVPLTNTFPYTGLNKELDVRYALYYERNDFTDTIDVLSAHGLHLDGFVEGTITLDQVPATFAGLLAGAEGGKVVIAP